MDTAAAHYIHTASISIGFRTMEMKTISFKEQYEIMEYDMTYDERYDVNLLLQLQLQDTGPP